MEAAGVALSAVATIDLCFKYGKKLLDLCTALQNAHNEILEKVTRVRNQWKRISVQAEFIKNVWDTLDTEHQEIHFDTLQVLLGKLSNITNQLGRLVEKKSSQFRVKRWKYVWVRDCLDKVINDLVAWQDTFDPSWFLILRISNPIIDQELRKGQSAESSVASATTLRNVLKQDQDQRGSVFLPRDGLDYTMARPIFFTSARYIRRANSEKWVIIDQVPCTPHAESNSIVKDVRELARRLSSSDPNAFGILKCKGVVRNYEGDTRKPISFDFVFNIPQKMSCEPSSLRKHLSLPAEHTLTQRLHLARQLARSVCYVHTLGFVHKNICPETIIGFKEDKSSLGQFFLTGFEKVRMAEGRTLKVGDLDWVKNLYRHPRRQGLHPEDDYVMQHDIYSLGVCLLEIGLWETFVLYDQDTRVPSLSDRLSSEPGMPGRLISLATDELAQKMGERYSQVVVNCLTCLDEENPDFGDQAEFEDADGILVGVRFIEKVLFKLNGIVM